MNEIGRDIFLREARRSHSIAVSKEWWILDSTGKADVNSRDIGELLMLANSELSEALEVYRTGRKLTDVWYGEKMKPEGFPIEVADYVIRVFDTIIAYEGERPMVTFIEHFRSTGLMGFEAALSAIPANVGRALLGITRSTCLAEPEGKPNPKMCEKLTAAVLDAFLLCSKHGIDLWKAIEIKSAYNETREKRHGGKIA